MDMKEVKLAEMASSWKGNYETQSVKTITLCVTEDCNLACKYCYMTGKNIKNKMSFDIAKRCIDYILSNRDIFYEDSVVWDFIGGEPFLEIDLIDKICDYIKLQMFLLKHPWFDSYRFSFSTNGLFYSSEKVQKLINKNKGHISIGISIDGNKIKHDLQRVYKNGDGSYEGVMTNVELWKKQFPNTNTKATFAHDDLPYLKDSIISLWQNGINDVSANVVFENVWKDGDDKILENQLDELGDYVIENKLWDKYYVRFFDPKIGNPLNEESKKHNFCGSGKMLAIDCEGNFFPCIRFLDFSVTNRKGRSIGNIDSGINENKLRAFKSLTLEDQSKKECLECEVASGCALCTGFNYDNSGSIFKRSTYICNLHKATVRANKKFWTKYEKATGNPSPRRDYESLENKKYIQVILYDNITPHCNYRNWNKTNEIMSKEIIDKAINFATINGFEITFLGDKSKVLSQTDKNIENDIFIVDAKNKYSEKHDNLIIVYDNSIAEINQNVDNCIILINESNLGKLNDYVKKVSVYNKRINIRLENINKWSENNLKEYDKQLSYLVDFIEECYCNVDFIEINILTDRLYLEKMCNCSAGTKTYTLAPNGKFYACPAFYFDNENNSIGDLEIGIINEDEELMSLNNAPICKSCDAYHCTACKFLNKKLTEEYNTPSKIQCLISHYERNKSRELQERLIKKQITLTDNIIDEITYLDPLEKFLSKKL
ncbi:MAG TPA: radical SAM protein [Clostridium sp.]|nr:radical SAM protein [Clostridium sp.]